MSVTRELQAHTQRCTHLTKHTHKHKQTKFAQPPVSTCCDMLSLTGTNPFRVLCQDLKLLTTLSQWTSKTKKNNKPRQKLEYYVIRVSCCFSIHTPTENLFSLCSYKSTNTTQPGRAPLWALNLLALLVPKSTNTDTLESHVVCNPPTKNFGCDRRPKKTGFTLPILLFPDFSRAAPPAASKFAKLAKFKWLRIRCVCGLTWNNGIRPRIPSWFIMTSVGRMVKEQFLILIHDFLASCRHCPFYFFSHFCCCGTWNSANYGQKKKWEKDPSQLNTRVEACEYIFYLLEIHVREYIFDLLKIHIRNLTHESKIPNIHIYTHMYTHELIYIYIY